MALQLSQFAAHDFEDYFRLVSDAKVMEMITGQRLSLEESQKDFADILADNAIHPDLGHFQILDPSNGQFIGYAKLALSAEHPQTAELGYMLLPEYWGQGIANQVAEKLVQRALNCQMCNGFCHHRSRQHRFSKNPHQAWLCLSGVHGF